jgi:hypothetical protein
MRIPGGVAEVESRDSPVAGAIAAARSCAARSVMSLVCQLRPALNPVTLGKRCTRARRLPTSDHDRYPDRPPSRHNGAMALRSGDPVRAKRYMGQGPWPEAVFLGPGPDLVSQSLRQSSPPVKRGLVRYPDGEVLAVPYEVIERIESD